MVINPEEVHWTVIDFLAAAALLLSLGICIDQIQRRVNSSQLRWIAIVIAILCMATLWIELAVGIF